MLRKRSLLLISLFFLTASLMFGQNYTITLGTGTEFNTSYVGPTPYGVYSKNHRQQYLVYATELLQLGLDEGNIFSLAFNVKDVGLCNAMPAFTIKMKATTVTGLTSTFDNGNYTTVRTYSSYMPISGWNTHSFTTPFYWDGTSNVIIDICFDMLQVTQIQYNASVYYTTTSGQNTSLRFASNNNIACGTNLSGITSTSRANMKITGKAASCIPPTAITFSDIAAESAGIQWVCPSSVTKWEVTVIDSITGDTASLDTVKINPNCMVSGLEPETTYIVFIRSLCTGNSSYWQGPFSFKTTCSHPVLPLFEGFEFNQANNTLLQNCWLHQAVSGYPKWSANNNTSSFQKPRTGSFNAGLSSSSAPAWAFQAVHLSGGQSYAVELFARQSIFDTSLSHLSVYYGIFPHSNYMSNIIIPAAALKNGNYQTLYGTITPVSGGTYYIGLQGMSSVPSNGIVIDDLTVYEIQPCAGINPATLNIENIKLDSVDINWIETGNATQWQIEYAADTMPLGTGTSVFINSNPYTLTGLNHSSKYRIYLRSICAAGDTSIWKGPYTFMTRCPAYDVPLYEDFNQITPPDLPLCWKKIEHTYSFNTQIKTSFYDANSPPGKIVFVHYNWDSTGILMLVSPELALPLNNLYISFFARKNNNILPYLVVGSVTDPFDNNTFTPIDTVLLTNSYKEYVLFLDSFPLTNNKHLAFTTINSANTGAVLLDDIEINSIPSCFWVFNVNADSITSTSAHISWTPWGTEQEWHILVIDSLTGDTTAIFTADTVPEYTITGLNPATYYTIKVQADCGSGDMSVFSDPCYLLTLQEAATIPFSEDFENGPNGWTFINGTHTNRWYVGNTTFSSGANAAYISNNGGLTNTYSNSTSTVYLYRDITFPDNTANFELQFDWKCFGVVWYDFLRIYLIPDTVFPVSGLYLSTSYPNWEYFNNHSNWTNTHIEIDAATFGNKTNRLVFLWRNDSEDAFQPPAAIDNLKIITCITPENLSATGNTSESAILHWSKEVGVDMYPLLVIHNATGDTVFNGVVNDTLQLVTGLFSDSDYSFYIRSDCGNGGLSEWTGPCLFHTTQILATLPFTEDFEQGPNNWTVVNGTQTNKWIIGTDVALTGQQSAYISSDNVSNNYLTDMYSVVHLYRDIVFPDTNYSFNLKFNWKGMGEGVGAGLDYLMVSLLPVSAFPQAGFMHGGAFTGKYNMQNTWQEENINFSTAAYANKTWRLVFSWKNDNWAGEQPPVAIDDINITFSDVSVATHVNESGFALYPNPAQNSFCVLPKKDMDNITIELYNVNGQLLVKKSGQDFIKNKSIDIDISKLKPGLFNVKISNEKFSACARIIKL